MCIFKKCYSSGMDEDLIHDTQKTQHFFNYLPSLKSQTTQSNEVLLTAACHLAEHPKSLISAP